MVLKGKIRNEWVEALLNDTLDKEQIPQDIIEELKEKYRKFERNSGLKDYVVKTKVLKKEQGDGDAE
jgi:hypothetical protein